MATFAGRRLHTMIDNVAHIVAIELLASVQGVEFRAPAKTSETLQRVRAQVREQSPRFAEDRSLSPDIEAVAMLIHEGRFREYATAILPSSSIE